ncbi:hypothetical protein PAAG_11995 [Paracoccidioides lutzii Pb01]|uniref:Uncharacterized protein n=1 Tax=Paracoccidioides lutzii (strain ATCC MYA-826 / Pb01) TaxID=502779 RepID=A0A0A2V0I9_PARBA|nr:hypothetical protein PAAG_11995 [Paracoccidioides lutzii Pb01]KGQ01316.1 hypothetical protein PAAG_11995 [Paracoccidioides lutzii Pb01]
MPSGFCFCLNDPVQTLGTNRVTEEPYGSIVYYLSRTFRPFQQHNHNASKHSLSSMHLIRQNCENLPKLFINSSGVGRGGMPPERTETPHVLRPPCEHVTTISSFMPGNPNLIWHLDMYQFTNVEDEDIIIFIIQSMK